MTVYVAPELRTDIKRLALDTGNTVEALVTEAVERLVADAQKGKRK